MRSTAADRSWQERSVLMELFYQGLTSHDGRYFIFVRTSRGRHISEAASGKERQDEMEYQPMGSSRATGVAKRRKTRFRSRVEEENRNPGRDEGWRETRKGLLGLFARRWDGDDFAWSGLARNACHVVHRSRAVNLQANAGLWIFFDKHAIQSLLVFASSRYMQNFIKIWWKYSNSLFK